MTRKSIASAAALARAAEPAHTIAAGRRGSESRAGGPGGPALAGAAAAGRIGDQGAAALGVNVCQAPALTLPLLINGADSGRQR
jgi:hypothetical protein